MAHEGSFVRWQSIAINQLGYAVGLILTFATASLGFGLALVKDKDYVPGCWGKAFMSLALLSLALSVALGLWCVVNRLRDFRKTRSIARDREDWEPCFGEAETDRRLHERRTETQKLGRKSWLLFWWQLGMFALGALALTVTFAIVYRTKLF